MSRPSARDRSPGLGAGTLALALLPVLAFAVAAFLLEQDARLSRTLPPLPPREGTVEVTGHTGTLVGRGGARVDLRLSPLHADARRQDFDRDRLRRRYALGGGEPWRLELRYEGDPEVPDAEEPTLDLANLRVEDASGATLAPFDAPPANGRGLLDPLAALLARGPRALAPGDSATRILWGGEPEAPLLVHGLVRREVDGSTRPLFAPTVATDRVALIGVPVRQVRELSLHHAEVARAPEAERRR